MPEIASVGLCIVALVALFFIFLSLGSRWIFWVLQTLNSLWKSLPLPGQYKVPYKEEMDYDALRTHIIHVIETTGEYEGSVWLIRKISYIMQPYVVRKILHEDPGNRNLWYLATMDEALDLFLEKEHLDG